MWNWNLLLEWQHRLHGIDDSSSSNSLRIYVSEKKHTNQSVEHWFLCWIFFSIVSLGPPAPGLYHFLGLLFYNMTFYSIWIQESSSESDADDDEVRFVEQHYKNLENNIYDRWLCNFLGEINETIGRLGETQKTMKRIFWYIKDVQRYFSLFITNL